MARSEQASVAVIHNFVGEDEYEVLRRKVQDGSIESPTGRLDDIAQIATVRDEIRAIASALECEGFATRIINIQDDFERLLGALKEPRPDAVFNLVESFRYDARQEARVAALYELLGIPYTGSPPLTLAVCQRKGLTKQILKANGIPTPRYKLVARRPIPRLSGLRYPLIVKPSSEDASLGIHEKSIVENREQLENRVNLVLTQYRQPALIEEFVAGRELGISVLGNRGPQVLPVEEVDFSGLPPEYWGIVTFESKWNPLHEVFHKADLICPARLPRVVKRRVRDVALRTYQILGCRDYARIDMRLDKESRLYVLEVNPNPDLTEGVAFMASAAAAGLTFGATLRRIVEEALARGRKTDRAAAESRPDESILVQE
ncbi:MAG: ATP-grasp domain-containing protein [Acidobacteriota bacterium]